MPSAVAARATRRRDGLSWPRLSCRGSFTPPDSLTHVLRAGGTGKRLWPGSALTKSTSHV